MARQVEVPPYEIEEHVTVDPDRTALVIIDMQNDFVRADGALSVPGAADTVAVIRQLVKLARSTAMPVFYSQDTHQEGDPEWKIWPKHCERGSEGWQIIDELKPAPGDRVFEKVRYDAFYGTHLDHELRLRGIDTLIICGTVASICVHYTAASAGLRWYRVIHPVDALSALHPFDMEAALRQASFLFQATLTKAAGITPAVASKRSGPAKRPARRG
ncbi:MAG: cysteine hydrolase [Gemmatimonadetes bacterium]|nr:cysteine hydrolase [Gemmatimonadota bacterium]